MEAVSFRRIATVKQLQLEYTHTHTHTHTVNFTVSLVRLRLEAYLAKRQQKIIPEFTCTQLE